MTSPGYGFEIEIDSKEVIKAIETLDNRLGRDMGNWMKGDLHDHLVHRAENRFANEGDDVSGPWAPLGYATQKIRAAKGFPPAHPINVRTHDLQRFIVGSNGNVIAGGDWQFVWPDSPPDAELQTKLKTAQIGRNSPPTTARPVLGLGVQDYNDVLDSLATYLVDGII